MGEGLLNGVKFTGPTLDDCKTGVAFEPGIPELNVTSQVPGQLSH